MIPPQNDPADSTLWPSAFLGFTMMQNRMAIPAWSYTFELLAPKTVVELGTHEGGLSVLLAIAAKNYGARFVTFDRGDPSPKWKWWFSALEMDFRRREDFLSRECLTEIKALIEEPGVTVVICDGGNKPLEFNTLAEYLKPGDVIGAHDFQDNGSLNCWRSCEIQSKDVAQACLDFNLEPWNHELFERAAWLVKRKR